MTEPIEKWRNEFESYSDEKFIRKFPSGTYQWQFMEDRWNGFTMAKRSQPVVEINRIGDFQIAPSLAYNNLIGSLKAAGINYRIKGE